MKSNSNSFHSSMTNTHWEKCFQILTEDQCLYLSSTRGYSVAFVKWLHGEKLIGFYNGCPAFPVQGQNGEVIGIHYRDSAHTGRWAYAPNGLKVTPLIIGDPSTSDTACVFESQWDAFAVIEKLGWPLEGAGLPKTFILITRGAGNGALASNLGPNITKIMAFKQNDPVDAKGGPAPADKWINTIFRNAPCSVLRITPPLAQKDWNDWTRAGATTDEILNAIGRAIHVTELPKRIAKMKNDLVCSAPPIEMEEKELPEWQIASGHVTLVDSSERLFKIMSQHTTLFTRNGSVTELFRDDNETYLLRPVTPQGFRSRIECFVKVRKWVVGANGEQVLKPCVLAVDMAKAILESLAVRLLKPIRGLANCAFIQADESNQCRIVCSGYDEQTGYLVIGGQEPADVPLEDAVKRLAELFDDFDFQTPGDRSRALASCITPALKLGGHVAANIPADVAEANESQSGKTYRQRMVAAIYSETVSLVTQKEGGVGSDDEAFNEALICGRPFIQFDNRRGKLDSKHLEAFLTAFGTFPARVPHNGSVLVDPGAYFIFLSSNGVEATRDFANRASIIRIRKRPREFNFRQYPEGDVLDHIRANQGYYLGCVFAIVRAWLEKGKQKSNENRHDFREWCQSLDWIVQNILGEAPLMDGHESAQQRVSVPALTFIRNIAVVAEKMGKLDSQLSAQEIYEIASESGIGIPGYRDNGESAACKIIGQNMSRLFELDQGEAVEIESYRISREIRQALRPDGNGSYPRKVYTISRI